MRIAVLASNYIRIPPRAKDVPKGTSGATEEIVSRITEELVRRGHHVTLFASGDSKTKANLVSITDHATGKDKNIGLGPHEYYEYALISKAYQMANDGEFDIIHSHFDIKSAFYTPLCHIPTVSTLHSPLNIVSPTLKLFKNTQYFVSISDSQRRAIPDLKYISTIYHGLNLNDYPYDGEGGGYLVWVGRISPDKGTDLAIKVAQHLGMKLLILGWAKGKYMKYYGEKVKPFIDGKNIINHGFISRHSLKNYLKKARALIFPVRWEEPFGLVMIEAMACGTPVVAYSHGSVPEVVVDGKTGYIVENSTGKSGKYIIKTTGLEGLVEGVRKLNNMSKEEYGQIRNNCREHVQEKFTIKQMIEGYERAYEKILGVRS